MPSGLYDHVFSPDPQLRGRDMADDSARFRGMASDPGGVDAVLRRLADPRTVARHLEDEWPPVNARELRMQTLSPGLPATPSTFAKDLYNEVAPLGLLLDSTGRSRDTAIRSAQELAKGNYAASADLASRVLPAAMDPEQAAGGYGQPDDWRSYASPGMSLILDLATDPMNYVGAGALRGGASRVARGVQRAANAVDTMRYGRGVPAFLEDANGTVIRRLRNAEVLPRPRPLGLEYVR